VLRAPRAAMALLRSHRRIRLALICALVALPLLGGGWLLLRRSALVAVSHIRVAGVHGPQAGAIEAALRHAAAGMSTLEPNVAALRAAVARFPQVGALRASTSFPHGMSIVVDEQPPVAALLVGGVRMAAAGDGVALGNAVEAGSLPTVADDALPAAGTRLRNPLVREALTVLGAAPPAIDRLAAKAYFGARGLTVVMRDGLVVYFGDDQRPHAKWLALARVLADHSSAGAIYVDVRLPGRPAAGFPAGAGPPEAQSEGALESSGSQNPSAVATLAAGLAAATPKGKAEAEKAAARHSEAAASGGAGEASSSSEGEATESESTSEASG
jgi:cell division protein FtsQ